MWITSSLEAAKTPTTIALGNFDGVHLGHQQVMAQILCEQPEKQDDGQRFFSEAAIASLHSGLSVTGYSHLASQLPGDAQANETAATRQWATGQSTAAPYTTVVTFSPHPHEYFSKRSRLLLTPVAEKSWQLGQLGIQQLVMLPFNQSLAEMSPLDFIEKILICGLQAQRISVGSDFHFGKGRSGSAQTLVEIAAKYGVPVVQVSLKYEGGDRISSSRIRTALQAGEPTVAARLLGRPYILTGQVVRGQQLGRTIGFPTANLQIPTKKFLPYTGVYSVWVYGVPTRTEPLKGVMNIGHRPTVNGQSLSVEVHILNWTGDLYGRMLTVSLQSFIRPEQKFDSLEALKSQIARDRDVAAVSL